MESRERWSVRGLSELLESTEDERRAVALKLFRTMAFIRRYEEVAQALFRRGAISGAIHLCMGQEAVPTGVCSVLRDGDLVAATYRNHGQSLALGMDPVAAMAELLGRRTGICGGRSGSMNVVDLEHGLIGCYGIVGGSIAAATGAALSLRHKGEGVAVAFFGDGAVNQAYFYECLNFAKVMTLPVVYVCENNQYGEFTAMESVTPGGILPRPRAMGVPSESVDGMDVKAVRERAAKAVEHARSGAGPAFIEALTYRYNDHARGDPIDYRAPGELDEWRARDPLLVTRRRLVDELGVTDAEVDAELEAANTAVEAVRAESMEASYPDPAEPVSEFKGA